MNMHFIWEYVRYALWMGTPIFVMWIIWRMRHIKTVKRSIVLKEELVVWTFVAYIVFLYMITVFRQGLSVEIILSRPHDIETINMIPLIELKKLWGYGYFWSFTYNVLGNIIWFLPLGVLVPALKGKWGIIRVVGTGALVSLSIEILQFICVTGISDVDDVILNTIGTLVGYIVYRVMIKVMR